MTWLIILSVAKLLLVVGGLYVALRAVKAFEQWTVLYGKQPNTSNSWLPSQSKDNSAQVVQTPEKTVKTLSVPEVSPAAILKRAPKPAGFGSANDGNKQPQQPNHEGSDKPQDQPPDCTPGKL